MNNKTQNLELEESSLANSNNLSYGNAARDIINHYGEVSGGKGTLKSSDVIKNNAAIIRALLVLIDKQQDEIDKILSVKNKLMDMLLDDREIMREKVFNLEHKK